MSKKLEPQYFPTKYSEEVKIGSFERFLKPSMTEPDNALSIPEIIARFTRGQGIVVEQHAWTQGAASEGGAVMDDLQDFFGKPEALKEAAPAAPQQAATEPPQDAEPKHEE